MPVVRAPAGLGSVVHTVTGGLLAVEPGAAVEVDLGTAWALVNGGAGWTLVSGGSLPAINPVCPPWHLRDLPPGQRSR